MTIEKFNKNILDFYYKNTEKNSPESLHQIEQFITLLPPLSKIREILLMELTLKKELVTIKVVLDIYEHYYKRYDCPLYEAFLSEFIPTALLFYAGLSDEDIRYVYNTVIDIKDVSDLLCKLSSFNAKRRTLYIKYLENMKNSYINLSGGNECKHFCN
jgi:hypothetical protein